MPSLDQPLSDGAFGAFGSLLERASEIAERVLAPAAAQVDQAATPPIENIRALADAGLLGLTTPVAYGGHGAPPAVVRAFHETIASACGVTIFILLQHFGGCRHIAGGENEELKAALLPAFARGDRLCTLAFSHLRRPGPPEVRVRREGDEWIFDGVAPWLTGWGVATDVLLAGTLADGRSVWVVAPLVASAALEPSPPMRLCAMTASATVSLACRGLRVGMDRYVKTMTAEELADDTASAILFFSSLSLGVARGALSHLRGLAGARPDAALIGAVRWLERSIPEARAAVDAAAALTGGDGFYESALRARALCVELGVRATQAAVVASGGSANQIEHPAQRLFREAMVYSLVAQTRDLRAETLARIAP